jgi:hypothetical protein
MMLMTMMIDDDNDDKRFDFQTLGSLNHIQDVSNYQNPYFQLRFPNVTAIGSTEGANQKMAVLGHFRFVRLICP